MHTRAILMCAIVAMATAQQPSPFISFSSSPPFSNGPPSQLQGRPGPGRPPGPGFSLGASPPATFGAGPGSSYKRPNSPSKLFSWLGSTMSKLPGFQNLPKIQYHKSKGPGSSPQNGPPSYFSPQSGAPQLPNSIYDSNPSPFGGSTVSFAPHSNSVGHSPVSYRQPQGPPPPSYASRPPPSFGGGGRPSFSSRPPPSFASRPPQFPPQFASSSPYSGPPSSPYPGPSSSPYSGPSSSPYSGPSPFANSPSSSPFGSSQGLRENLEVFPSQQIAYQTQTLGQQNQPSYEGNFGSELQNLYGSQSNKNPSFYPGQSASPSYDPQSSFSQNTPYVVPDQSNYGATFHSFEPVSVAPIYDIAQNFKPSSSDLSQSPSTAQQSHASIHDKPFSAIMDEYAAQADAATSGTEKMIAALSPGSDLATAASSNGLGGIKILGQSTNAEGNPVFEVVADANSPMYDGHPVDLSKLISMIEPGAQIDTIPQFGGEQGAASEQQPVYVQAPAGMTADGVTGNKKITSGSQSKLLGDDELTAASESRPAILKPDGSRLSEDDDDKLIKEHFDKEIILLQENNDKVDLTGDTVVNGTKLIDNDQLYAIVKQLRNANSGLTSAVVPNQLTQNNLTDNQTSEHPHHNYNAASPNTTDNTRQIQAPVINPFVDSVEPSIGDDDDLYTDDDMFVESAGDLAASASNVKSVAIIVTPPPNYIKIKNKYTRWGRDMVSTSPPTTQITSSVDDAFSESLVNSKVSNSSIPSPGLVNDTLTNSTTSKTARYPIYRRKINDENTS